MIASGPCLAKTSRKLGQSSRPKRSTRRVAPSLRTAPRCRPPGNGVGEGVLGSGRIGAGDPEAVGMVAVAALLGDQAAANLPLQRPPEPPSGTLVHEPGARGQRVQATALLVGADIGCCGVEMMGLEPTTPCLQISTLRAACQALFLQVIIERRTPY
jgi:hypothetical protein